MVKETTMFPPPPPAIPRLLPYRPATYQPTVALFSDLLGVSPSAGDDEIKKAYRKKALKHHPDKGGDPELFKELTHAYEVLSDNNKRAVYDQAGKEGLENGGPGGMGGMDPQDLFSQLFGGGGGGFFGGGGGRPSGPRRGKDLVHRIAVTLEDLYRGKVQKLALSKSVICKGCDGRGGKKGAVKTCPSCRGQGVKVMFRQLGPMMQQIQQPCNECEGTGEIMDPKDRCKTCHGKKVVSERKVLEVHIDKGMKSGQQIKFNGESDQAPGIVPGDVVIVIEEKPHARFQRKGDDLFTEADIDLLTALAGGEFTIPHLDDRTLHVTIVPGEIIKPGALKTITGQGMPSYRHHELGDLFVRLNVIFPDSLDPTAFPLLEKALPKRPELPKLEKGHHLDEVTLEEPNDRQRRTAASNGDDMDEDDDDRPGVQCAQQ
ncbi:Mitochondrial protein import protein MAS5 [Vanrija pseudolonga]|uniref:Mitochondrial protein import protein MAS5 n=1 Tax=Vanrija pseudolonga TaxID=143232 RepID=A0AAF0YD47_9TREE|nr:Mitochondrial protein import protein MAS5 [Vanrija pseudolonga]